MTTTAQRFPVGTTFEATHGHDTRYTILGDNGQDRCYLRVDILNRNTGQWQTSNHRSPDRHSRIAGLLEEGKWITL